MKNITVNTYVGLLIITVVGSIASLMIINAATTAHVDSKALLSAFSSASS